MKRNFSLYCRGCRMPWKPWLFQKNRLPSARFSFFLLANIIIWAITIAASILKINLAIQASITIICFIFLLYPVTIERKTKLLDNYRAIGLQEFSYFSGWFFSSFIVCCSIIVLMMPIVFVWD